MVSKKFLAAVTAAALAVSSLASVTAFADGETESTVTLTADTSWYTSGDYTLYDAEDLAGLAELVNGGTSFSGKTVTIANDIDCGGAVLTPIGTRSKPFKGTLCGAAVATVNDTVTYATIKNAEINFGDTILNVGVVGFVEDGTVKNLNFEDIEVVSTANKSSSTFDKKESTTGVAIGALNGGTLENLVVQSGCSVSGVYRTGGIAGDASDNDSEIKNCTNYASVVGSGNYTGGIVGATHNVSSYSYTVGTKISGCKNKGSVSGTSEVGGIAGYTDRASISECSNDGNITGTGNYGTGGIVGCDIYNPTLTYFTPSNGSSITDCENSGEVCAPRVGGILGSFVVAPSDSPASSDINSTITGCTNTGKISTPTGSGVCGAIYGAPISYMYGDSEDDLSCMIVVISGCKVGGTVEGNPVPDKDEEDEEDIALKAFISPSGVVSLNGNTRYTEETAE